MGTAPPNPYAHRSGERPTRRVHHASLFQLLGINVVLILATGTIILRPYFPTWATPQEYGLLRRPPAAAPSWLGTPEGRRLRAELRRDSRMLIVGDSVVKSCPWLIDKLSYPGMDTRGLYVQMQSFLADREYEHIVLWTGTWDLMRGRPYTEYVDEMVAMAHLAKQHAAHVTVLSPMPTATDETLTPKSRANVTAVASAVRELRARVPWATTIDMTEFRAMAENTQRMEILFLDNLHISRQGYEVLNAKFLQLSALAPPPTST